MIVFHAAIFAWFLCFWTGLIHLDRGGMPLHDGVGINCEKGATTEIKAQEPCI